MGVFALITLIVGSLNTLEYFFGRKNHFKKYEGVIVKVDYKTYIGRRQVLYGRNDIKLSEVKRKFFVTNEVSDGAYIDIKIGDTVVIWTRRWFQMIYSPVFDSNVFYVEKNGIEVYDNLKDLKANAFSLMCLFGGLALILSAIYLDVVKGISLENWFQRKILKNPAYANKKKKSS